MKAQVSVYRKSKERQDATNHPNVTSSMADIRDVDNFKHSQGVEKYIIEGTKWRKREARVLLLDCCKSPPDHSLHLSLRLCVCVCRGRLHFYATGQPTDETLLGMLISHISETWQEKASQTAAGASPICLLLSSNQGQIDLF